MNLDLRRFLKIAIISLMAVTHTQCKLLKSTISSDSGQSAYLEIEKTGCMGPCPVYKVHFSRDSTWYQGIRHVEKSGAYRASLSMEEWIFIQDVIQKSESLESAYKSTNALDLPTTYLRLSDGTGIKEISIYGTPPKELATDLDEIERLVRDLEWELI